MLRPSQEIRRSIRMLLVFTFTAASAFAQTSQPIVIGQSTVLLTGPWKFSPGDSPIVNGAPLWAQPNFDDSQWTSMDLTPPAGSHDIQFTTGGFTPGWTRLGYPDLVGYAWYRLRIHVQTTQLLSLDMPIDVDDGYQAFANGQYIGEFGEFHPGGGVTLHYGMPVALRLPAPGPDGEIELTFRFFMSAVTPLRWPDAGGLHYPPILGSDTTVSSLAKTDSYLRVLTNLGTVSVIPLCVLAIPLALWAAFANRHDRAWIWLFLALVAEAGSAVSTALGELNPHVSMWAGEFWRMVVFDTAFTLCWLLFWWNWFGLRNRRWIAQAAYLLTALDVVFGFCFESPTLDLHFASHTLLVASNTAKTVISIGFGALLLIVLIEGFRRDRTAALLATVPILLLEFSSLYVILLVTFHFSDYLYIDDVAITYSSLAAIVLMLVVGGLALRRFLLSRDRELLERESVARDIEQARQLQQRVLVPETMRSAAFSVQVEYHPAQTVGGDFFQTICQPDGSILIVIGDVSGKGISAAMLVAVLVGAARAKARETSDPAAILAELNTQLIGRSGDHFATCLAAVLSPDGTLRMANGGHLSPYRNGLEIDLEGSLPLGMAEHLEPAVKICHLAPGDLVTFLSDGVIEARNAEGRLFGFERTAAISTQSAEQIAAAAQAFGQEDDITVLTLQFAAAGVAHA